MRLLIDHHLTKNRNFQWGIVLSKLPPGNKKFWLITKSLKNISSTIPNLTVVNREISNNDNKVNAIINVLEQCQKLHTYTYIIGHYNPSVRIIDLVSHTTYVVCVNFIHKWWDLQSTPNNRFFEKLFTAILFYSQSFCQKSAERKSPKKYFSYFVLMSGLELEPWNLEPVY